MFGTVKATVPRDTDFAPRVHDLECMRRVLRGEIYDFLLYEFHQERKGRDGAGEYIPIADRRPSVRYNLCRMVVEDSTTLLFGEGRFPKIETEDKELRDQINDIIAETKLARVMLAAALRGSIGSVAVEMRILKGRIFWRIFDTVYLTPTWRADEPDALERVVEKRKVKGAALREQGYAIDDKQLQTDFWFLRHWDASDELWFVPWPVADDDTVPAIDNERSVAHMLGFCPIVWIKNLPGGDDIDGHCTFRPAVETQMEIEYQLSQGGRGLKYSSDPTLLIKEPATTEGDLVRSASSALIVSADGDARLLEIGGTAVNAVLDYAKSLRELALESIHGNRSSADKVSAAQSGRALELLHQPLIQLADNLRATYGEEGLLNLIRMVVKASNVFPLVVYGEPVAPMPLKGRLSLKWPPFFVPTFNDMVEQATGIGLALQGNFTSLETAVTNWAPSQDVEDVSGEIAKCMAQKAEQAAQQISLKAATPKDPGQGTAGAAA